MLNIVLHIALGLLIITFILSMIRLIKGPTLQDRVVALDMIGGVAAGMIIIFMILTDSPRYLDIALVLSLILFLGTAAIARFLNKEKK